MSPLPAVDSHLHIFSASAPAVAQARYRPAYAAKLETLRVAWDTNGITHGVVVQPSFFGADNSEMLAAVAGDRQHLRGVAVLDPSATDDTLEQLQRAGVTALRLNLKGHGDYAEIARSDWKALYRRIHARGWHLEVFTDAGRLPDVMPALEGSDIAVAFDHFGNPGVEAATIDATFAAVQALSATRPTYVKLSGPYRLGGVDRGMLAARWIAIVGESGLLWGSDWPWTNFEERNDYRRLREDLVRWVGADAARAALWDNAARLYRF